MSNNLDPEKKVIIHKELRELCSDHTMSESARILKISPSSVRWHALVLGLEFKKIHTWTRKKIVPVEGKYFDERHRENWLV